MAATGSDPNVDPEGRPGLTVLLVAYEFPPSPSPQSLRWAFLTRELCENGFNVHVLTPALRLPQSGGAESDPRVRIHRTYPGLVSGSVQFLRNWRSRAAESEAPASLPLEADRIEEVMEPSVLNWKGRLLERTQRLMGRRMFPDARGEWKPFATARLRQLLETLKPDVVLGSHEPATSLEVALDAARAGFPFVADMGDPVLCFYTPERWRKRALAVERQVCAHARHVIVTTDGARALLIERHRLEASAVSVLRQGFDRGNERGLAPSMLSEPEPGVLDLLYTGSFYSFRRPVELVEAVVESDFARLSIATSRASKWLQDIAQAHPDKIRLLGFLAHDVTLATQRSADVLVNIANDDPAHIPGKVYEYLGAGRPILHLRAQANDETDAFLVNERRGVACGNSREEIARVLDALMALKEAARLDEAFTLDPGSIDRFSWQAIGRQLAQRLGAVAGA